MPTASWNHRKQELDLMQWILIYQVDSVEVEGCNLESKQQRSEPSAVATAATGHRFKSSYSLKRNPAGRKCSAIALLLSYKDQLPIISRTSAFFGWTMLCYEHTYVGT